jgi:hypothetical protein
MDFKEMGYWSADWMLEFGQDIRGHWIIDGDEILKWGLDIRVGTAY